MRAAALVLAAGAALLVEAGIGAQTGRPSGHMLSYTGAPTLGDPQAPLVLIEYSDFHCPFCRQHVTQTLPHIKKDYVATGKLLYVFRPYPASARPGGLDAAIAAQCAGRQDLFWELHDRLFSAPRPVQARDLERHARAAGVDAGAFRTCFKAGVARTEVQAQAEEGRRLGLGGTPSFVVGYNDPPRLRVVQRIGGAQSYEAFRAVFEALLKSAVSSGADTGG
jgi:protein-disulfide isomerase